MVVVRACIDNGDGDALSKMASSVNLVHSSHGVDGEVGCRSIVGKRRRYLQRRELYFAHMPCLGDFVHGLQGVDVLIC
jgi:hypothetical protein